MNNNKSENHVFINNFYVQNNKTKIELKENTDNNNKISKITTQHNPNQLYTLKEEID